MAEHKRSSYEAVSRKNVGAGPHLAKIVGHLDTSFMGGLEVVLLRDRGNVPGEETQVYTVRCASPFFGYTGFEYMGENTGDASTLAAFNDTQKSYGMWMVPPDIGVTVLVVFINGDPGEGYWIGCIPSNFANHMVPAIGGSTQVDLDDDDKKKFNTKLPLPVAEINRRINGKNDKEIDAKKIKKPLHPIAEKILAQGLIEDDARGVTTTSARREVPSMVFGVSTPGPVDRRPGAKKSLVGTKQHSSNMYVSRLGGTQLVMDDGDERFQRKTPAGTGPVEYADVLAGEKGNPEIPYNEYFRIRTRTGHQLLMHNSEDLIYIGNAKGTAWVELSSNGKIDIFAADSISIHTENDLNIRANRDINLEAGRNINMKATAEYKSPDNMFDEKNIFDTRGHESGRIQIESAENFNLLIGRNGKIHVRNDEGIQGNLDVKVMGNMRLAVQDKDQEPTHTNIEDNKIIAEQPEDIKGLHIVSFENTRLTTVKDLDVSSGGKNAFTAAESTDIKSGGNHTETAAQIHMNGPQARAAAVSEVADKIKPLPTRKNILTDSNEEWASTKYQKGTIDSIMTRIPMHEPWALHENFAPEQLTQDNTDRELEDE